ncbi:uncharacterized protein METZ01_LOCUS454371 [marine metagenome]|uniref:Uncharacterized protein n=1 Tax=marine metagenome TaxID=408172 RepID=A0A383A113_9ZZZZ
MEIFAVLHASSIAQPAGARPLGILYALPRQLLWAVLGRTAKDPFCL